MLCSFSCIFAADTAPYLFGISMHASTVTFQPLVSFFMFHFPFTGIDKITTHLTSRQRTSLSFFSVVNPKRVDKCSQNVNASYVR